MAQKSHFKLQQAGDTLQIRKTFPHFSAGVVKNPKYIQTKNGGKLMVDGWWKYARKPNYSADMIQMLCWSLLVPFPFSSPLKQIAEGG